MTRDTKHAIESALENFNSSTTSQNVVSAVSSNSGKKLTTPLIKIF